MLFYYLCCYFKCKDRFSFFFHRCSLYTTKMAFPCKSSLILQLLSDQTRFQQLSATSLSSSFPVYKILHLTFAPNLWEPLTKSFWSLLSWSSLMATSLWFSELFTHPERSPNQLLNGSSHFFPVFWKNWSASFRF